GRQLELDRPLERLDGLRRPERGLDDRQVDLREHVVALAHETRIRLHPYEHVDVTGLAAVGARVAVARHADALTVVDAGRHFDLQLGLLEHAARPVAPVARMLDQDPSAVAVGTLLRADELAEHRARHGLEVTAAVAAWTPGRLGSRLDAVA